MCWWFRLHTETYYKHPNLANICQTKELANIVPLCCSFVHRIPPIASIGPILDETSDRYLQRWLNKQKLAWMTLTVMVKDVLRQPHSR